MTVEATLAIDPAAIGEGVTTWVVAARLIEIGGDLFAWAPESQTRPAQARFTFESERERDQFIAQARAIAGVSLSTLP